MDRATTLSSLILFTLGHSACTSAALTAFDGDANLANGLELVYDSVLDITWLADANLAASNTFGVSGIGATGSMDWFTAQNYIAAMNSYGGSGYLAIADWRLAGAGPLDGIALDLSTLGYDGSTDWGYQISAPVDPANNPNGASAGATGSELAYHYYNNFSAVGACHGIGSSLLGCVSGSVYGIDDASNTASLALFGNIQNSTYWSGTATTSGGSTAMRFTQSVGLQDFAGKSASYHIWAVTDGDARSRLGGGLGTPVVPVPASAWLFASALLGLSVIRRSA